LSGFIAAETLRKTIPPPGVKPAGAAKPPGSAGIRAGVLTERGVKRRFNALLSMGWIMFQRVTVTHIEAA
jgi:hypothetical protein